MGKKWSDSGIGLSSPNASISGFTPSGTIAQLSRGSQHWGHFQPGAVPRRSYAEALERAGLAVGELRENDYRFISGRGARRLQLRVQGASLVAHELR
jgi:hypothetical protein